MSKIAKGIFRKRYTLTISPIITDGVADPAGGTVSPAPGIYNHHKGDVVTVTATPATGYDFSGWDLDGVAHSENPIKITM